jgi:hypothetical protein
MDGAVPPTAAALYGTMQVFTSTVGGPSPEPMFLVNGEGVEAGAALATTHGIGGAVDVVMFGPVWLSGRSIWVRRGLYQAALRLVMTGFILNI